MKTPNTTNRIFIANRSVRIGLLVTFAVLLSGCKTFSPDGGMSVVSSIAANDLQKDVLAIRTTEDEALARSRVERLLKKTLTDDAAVQIALLNNRGLQASYNTLGIAEAALVQAHLPPAPSISLARLSSSVEVEIERSIVANILALITLPVRSKIAADRFHQAQLQAAQDTLRVAAETRRAYYRAVASRELVKFLTEAKASAEGAAEISQKLGQTGAINKLDQAREQVFYAEMTGQLASALQRANSEREKLIRLLGLWGKDIEVRLPESLPALPGRAITLPTIEVEAIRRRVDLHVARLELEALAKTYGLTNATRFINVLEVIGLEKTARETGGDKIRTRGIEVEFQIPIFDFGEVRVRQAEQVYMQAVNRLLQKAVDARSMAREAYRTYHSSFEIASHFRREVLPLRKIISDEMLLRYNAMQIDVFALLAEARQRTAATIATIDAQRDFWLSATNLLTAISGGGPDGGEGDSSKPMAAMAGEAGGH